MTKYHAKKVKTEDGTFDSQGEYRRWCELKLFETAGLIRDLKRQRKWPLIVGGLKVATYKDDANYTDAKTGKFVVEDVKGVKTPVYRLKKKLMKACHGIEILEVAA